MDKLQNYVGYTLGDLAALTGFNYKGWCIFQLRSKEDTTGARICEGFTLRNILRRHPELQDLIVKYAHDYYGENVLRVIDPADVAEG